MGADLQLYEKPGVGRRPIIPVQLLTRILDADTESAKGVMTGIGKTGIAFGDITKMGYIRGGAAADVAVTPVAGTLGTWVSGGFKEVDATNAPGHYQACWPEAAFHHGARWVDLFITFADTVAAGDFWCHVDLAKALARP